MYGAIDLFKRDFLYRKKPRKAVNGFLRFMLSVQPPSRYYHQTLTFAPPVLDPVQSRPIFERFIKTVCKRFSAEGLGVVFVEELTREGYVHYHVAFLLFNETVSQFHPSRTDRVRAYIFGLWKAANGGKSVHVANRLEVHEFGLMTIKYFAKSLRIPDCAPARGKLEWWGKGGKESVPV